MKYATSAHGCVVYVGPGTDCDVCDAPCRPAEELLANGRHARSPAVLLVDTNLAQRLGDPDAVPDHVVIVAADAGAAEILGRHAELSLAGVAAPAARRAALFAAIQTALAQFEVARFETEFHQLTRVGISLMREHDRKALLRMIVAQAKRLTQSDGGGLLLTRDGPDGRQWLSPVLYAFDSIDGEFLGPEPAYPVDETSLIGHAAVTKKPLVIADVYDLPHDERFEQAVQFDVEHDYRRRSMLAVPMLDQLDRVLGILICVNRKTDPKAKINTEEDADRYVIEYSRREVRLVRMFASLAAVAIENARLYVQLERAFESFVQAAVSAIDLRDPATAGHSLRVADLVTTLAADLERRESGSYHDVRFSRAQIRELHFAALLHDIGKIAVSEDLLLKSKKLPAGGWERIDARFDLIARTMQMESYQARVSVPASRHSNMVADPGDDPDETLATRLKELERYRAVVHLANEPNVLPAPIAAELAAIGRCEYERPDGSMAPYLTPEELHYLQLPKGNLDATERGEIESHATASRDLLSAIPWPDDLKGLVEYAYGHHELLNGSGYPRHLAGDQIPLQTRLITIADIFDALTAADRPYKPAVPVEQALEMMRAEAEEGKLDRELVRVLTESESYRRRGAADQHDL